MDTFSPVRYIRVATPWMIYIGGFGGYYCADFGYGGNYFSVTNVGPNNEVFNNDTFQQGILGGGQVGMHYHFQHPYYVGLVLSSAANANKARLTKLVNSQTSPGLRVFEINHKFRLQNSWDIAALIGADVTARTHIYAKVGGSAARFTHTVSITRAERFPFPIPFSQQTQRKTLWGWVLGLGLTHDLSKWFSVFEEYDHYDYGTRNLNSLNNIAPLIPILTNGENDRLTQHVSITANAIHVGLNFKLMDTFSHLRYIRVAAPWMIYIGGFGGYYRADFGYGGNYFSINSLTQPNNQLFNDGIHQQGLSGGEQVGVRYHFQHPYYVGLVLSSIANANRARLTEHIEDVVSPDLLAFDINHEFRLQSSWDIAALIGTDITAQTHIYAKVGGSLTRFTDTISLTQSNAFPVPIPFSQPTQGNTIWGWVLGLGLVHDLSQWFSVFAEYDHYDFGNRNLKSLDNVRPNRNFSRAGRLTQHVSITANTVRVGLNLKFEF